MNLSYKNVWFCLFVGWLFECILPRYHYCSWCNSILFLISSNTKSVLKCSWLFPSSLLLMGLSEVHGTLDYFLNFLYSNEFYYGCFYILFCFLFCHWRTGSSNIHYPWFRVCHCYSFMILFLYFLWNVIVGYYV